MTIIKEHKALILILFVSAAALFLNVGSYGLLESSDARYAEIARMMYVSGDYLHPNLLDVHHYHKPPFTYIIASFGYDLFGINPFGARFFLQISVLVQLILVYALALSLFEKKQTAVSATLIYFSFPLVLIASRNLTTDSFLAMFALLSMYAWVRYRKSGRFGYLYLFTISLAFGFLTKGPVIFVVPLVFVLAYNTVEKAKHGYTYHHALAWLLFLILSGSWYIYLMIQDTRFIGYFFGRQTADRFMKNAFNRTEPFWYFLAFAPLVGLPWLLALPYLIRKKLELFSYRSLPLALLAAVVIPLIFFSSSSSKRILYILPLYGMFALLIAHLLSKMTEAESMVVQKIVTAYALIFFSVFCAASFIDIKFVVPAYIGIASALLLAVVLAVYKSGYIQARSKSVYIAYIVSLFLLVAGGSVLSHNALKVNSTSPVTDFIIDNKMEKRTVLIYNVRMPSIAFNLNKSIVSLDDGSRDLERETQFEKDLSWKKHLIDLKNEEEIRDLKNIMKQDTILLIYKHELQDNSRWLLDYYKNKKTLGKWIIYY